MKKVACNLDEAHRNKIRRIFTVHTLTVKPAQERRAGEVIHSFLKDNGAVFYTKEFMLEFVRGIEFI